MTREYNYVADTEKEKYIVMGIIREHGGTVTNVSGYGDGYYIQMECTAKQAVAIENGIQRAIPCGF